ncbi:MAG: DNA gyrase inhibitor YacG [Planctomycetota bacterium]
MEFRCPVCDRAIPSSSLTLEGKRRINAEYFPFCSERCRLVDLGAWLDGDYRIPSEARSSEPQFPDE